MRGCQAERRVIGYVMQLKELGRTGVKVPEIGLGTWDYRGGTEPIQRGISLGAFLIDTAEMYSTEGVVGDAIKGKRDEVFIATKVSPNHLRYDDLINAASSSLKKLGADYIDLYQIHWANPEVPIGETMRAMETLVDMGRVRFIGVSNFSASKLQEAQDSMRKYDIACNQVLYNLFERDIERSTERSTLPYCQKNNITVMAYTPLASGGLASKPRFRGSRRMSVLEKISHETGKTMSQVALNWCTSREGIIAIPKSDKVERVVENCGASGWRLSAEQAEALDTAFA